MIDPRHARFCALVGFGGLALIGAWAIQAVCR